MFQNHAKGSSEGARLLAVIIERLLFVLWQPVLFRKSLHSEFQISSHSTHSTRSALSALSAPVFASQALDIFSKVVANCSAVIGIWRPEFSPPTGLDNHRKTTRKTQEDYDYDDGDSLMTMTLKKKESVILLSLSVLSFLAAVRLVYRGTQILQLSQRLLVHHVTYSAFTTKAQNKSPKPNPQQEKRCKQLGMIQTTCDSCDSCDSCATPR